jgi:enoyl-CoA hydratase/carnithine racemase
MKPVDPPQSPSAVRILVLDRPARRNALDLALSLRILAGLKDAMQDATIGAIVLAGEGPAFCAGLDLDFARDADAAAMARLVAAQQDIARTVLFGPKPVVAAVHGHAVGGGLEMALACDVIVWGESAEGWFPEVSRGLSVTGGASALLPIIVGLNRARAMVLLGERWPAERLRSAGLVHRVAPGGEVRALALEIAQRLAGEPSEALAFAKRSLLAGAAAAVENALEMETRAAVAGAARGA